MLQFDEVVNIREEICKGLQTEEWFRSSGEDLLRDSILLAGRENDCVFLFRFNTTMPHDEADHPTSSIKKRTHIGICNLRENRVKTLLSLDPGREEDIVHCTVNEEASLLVFCVASDGPIKARSSTTRDMRLYIAEVQQGLRRNALPIEIVANRLENMKSAQFIHSTGSERRTKLLIFEHTQYIGVLNLAVDGAGRLKEKVKRYKLTEWILGEHYWFQWDIERQHLFTIAAESNVVLLNVHQLSDKTTLERLFSIPIVIDSKSKRPRLSRLNLEQRCQDRNIVVLTNPVSSNDGILCLCNQVPYERRELQEAENPFTLTYQIFSFVHGKSFDVRVPNVPGRLRKSCIHFTLIGNYVVAYLPDVFTHCINVHDIADAGVLNIISPGESHSRVADSRGILSRVQLTYMRKKNGVFVYDSSSMCVYHVSLKESTLRDKFAERWLNGPRSFPAATSNSELTNQLAILQHIIQTTADAKRVRQLLECMRDDVTNTDTATVITEYILGSSFAVASRRPEMTKAFCRLLPFTCTESRPRYKVSVGGEEKKISVQIDISKCPANIEVNPEAVIRQGNDFFSFLYLHKTKRLDVEKRFSIQDASRKITESHALVIKNRPSGLKRRILNLVSSSMSGRKENMFAGSSLPVGEGGGSLDSLNDTFPDSLLNDDLDEKTTSVVNGYADVAMDHVRAYYPPVNFRSTLPRGSARPNPLFIVDPRKKQGEYEIMCWSYGRILVSQVKVLLHHLYSIYELSELHNNQYAVDARRGDIYEAFLMFERYQFAVLELGLPLPAEFPTLLSTVAYQSLPAEEFMQYVNNGIVELTDDFLNVLATDNTPSKSMVKCECLARMSPENALHWSFKFKDSPLIGASATRLITENLFATYYLTNPKLRRSKSAAGVRRMSSSSGGDGEEDDEFDNDLPRSYCFMVKKLTSSGWSPRKGSDSVTSAMLQRSIFYNTPSRDNDHQH